LPSVDCIKHISEDSISTTSQEDIDAIVEDDIFVLDFWKMFAEQHCSHLTAELRNFCPVGDMTVQSVVLLPHHISAHVMALFHKLDRSGHGELSLQDIAAAMADLGFDPRLDEVLSVFGQAREYSSTLHFECFACLIIDNLASEVSRNGGVVVEIISQKEFDEMHAAPNTEGHAADVDFLLGASQIRSVLNPSLSEDENTDVCSESEVITDVMSASDGDIDDFEARLMSTPNSDTRSPGQAAPTVIQQSPPKPDESASSTEDLLGFTGSDIPSEELADISSSEVSVDYVSSYLSQSSQRSAAALLRGVGRGSSPSDIAGCAVSAPLNQPALSFRRTQRSELDLVDSSDLSTEEKYPEMDQLMDSFLDDYVAGGMGNKTATDVTTTDFASDDLGDDFPGFDALAGVPLSFVRRQE